MLGNHVAEKFLPFSLLPLRSIAQIESFALENELNLCFAQTYIYSCSPHRKHGKCLGGSQSFIRISLPTTLDQHFESLMPFSNNIWKLWPPPGQYFMTEQNNS